MKCPEVSGGLVSFGDFAAAFGKIVGRAIGVLS